MAVRKRALATVTAVLAILVSLALSTMAAAGPCAPEPFGC
jgi:hypothetical protein